MNQQGNHPIKEFRIGTVTAAVWKNEEYQPDGTIRVRYSVRIQKRYRDKEGVWQNAEYYFPEELPKVQLVTAKAYEFVSLKESEDLGD